MGSNQTADFSGFIAKPHPLDQLVHAVNVQINEGSTSNVLRTNSGNEKFQLRVKKASILLLILDPFKLLKSWSPFACLYSDEEPTIVVESPFVFVIRDVKDNITKFIGRVMEPPEVTEEKFGPGEVGLSGSGAEYGYDYNEDEDEEEEEEEEADGSGGSADDDTKGE